MPAPDRAPSATLPKPLVRTLRAVSASRAASAGLLRRALCAGLACFLSLFAPQPCTAANSLSDADRPTVGEGYLSNPAKVEKSETAPGAALEQALRERALAAGELLDPGSRAWAGAQGLSLRLERAARLLASDVVAHIGDGRAAAASLTDGRVLLFGAGNCTSLAMPEGHPAYALALARDGSVLAAWAQGVGRLVFFDVLAPGCPASIVQTAMRGQISLSLSASGTTLAAQDADGGIWTGPRGGELRRVAALPGAPAAIGFSDAEGVLLVLDAQGRGGSWNPRTGKPLRPLTVPGGPFARGEFHGGEARLWTASGRLVRWDMLHNRPADAAAAPDVPGPARDAGWLELRGTDLYYAQSGLSWRPEPLYEPHAPQLAHSRRAACLRLADVDGLVRYFDARTGLAHPQCFSDDWVPVAVSADGTAQVPGLALRVFDVLTKPGIGSKVNSRAISDTHVVLWTDTPPDSTLRVQAPPEASASELWKAVDRPAAPPEAPSVPLRQGLKADAPVRALRLQ